MNWFLDQKTGTKLLVGFGTMIVLLGATITVAYLTITSLRDSQQRIFDREVAGAMEMATLRADLSQQRARMLETLLATERTRLETLTQDIAGRTEGIDEAFAHLSELYQIDAGPARKLGELSSTLAAFRQTRDELADLILAGRGEETRPVIMGVQTQRFDRIHALSTELELDLLDRARNQIVASAELSAQSVRTFVFLGGLAFAIGVVTTALLNRLIAGPLVEIAHAAERMAAGDLSVELAATPRTDEVGLLTRTFDRMSRNLRQQIGELLEGAGVLGSSANEIVASSAQLSSAATESAAAVSETTTTVEEIRRTAQMSSQKAKAVSDSAQNVARVSQEGRKSTEDATVGMDRIRRQMEVIAGSMVRLSDQSQTLGQIIATVEDLATQSNLLAVNAAIEAAKAGEHGKGFGVVAQEVRNLAEQSRQATTQVRTILGDIQNATTAAVLATEQGSKTVEAGGKQTESAGRSIQTLAGSVTETAQAATQIAASIQQQLVGMDQVAVAMENIHQASAQNVASAKQLETAAHSLNELGHRIKQMVERYKV